MQGSSTATIAKAKGVHLDALDFEWASRPVACQASKPFRGHPKPTVRTRRPTNCMKTGNKSIIVQAFAMITAIVGQLRDGSDLCRAMLPFPLSYPQRDVCTPAPLVIQFVFLRCRSVHFSHGTWAVQMAEAVLHGNKLHSEMTFPQCPEIALTSVILSE